MVIKMGGRQHREVPRLSPCKMLSRYLSTIYGEINVEKYFPHAFFVTVHITLALTGVDWR